MSSAALLAPSPPYHPASVCALSTFHAPEKELHELRGHRLHGQQLCKQLWGEHSSQAGGTNHMSCPKKVSIHT